MIGRIKNQTFSNVNKSFINHIGNKYKQLTLGEYMIERLMFKNINTTFGYNNMISGYNKCKAYSYFCNTVDKYNDFNVVFDDSNYDIIVCQNAFMYSKLTNNIGVIFSVADSSDCAFVTLKFQWEKYFCRWEL